MIILFSKMQSNGNDFVIFYGIAPKDFSTVQLQKIADRHFGIGCDQILFLSPSTEKDIDFDYRIVNQDGSESGQCGNGAACLAKFIKTKKINNNQTVILKTSTSLLKIKALESGFSEVDMGIPQFPTETVPLVFMGNPHLILKAENPEKEQVIFEKAQEDFESGINVSFYTLNKESIDLRVYERGVGPTLSCGSAASAAFAYLKKEGLWTQNSATMQLPGGKVQVRCENLSAPLYLQAPSHIVFEGELFL
jgi:diaminopimelate epimerase